MYLINLLLYKECINAMHLSIVGRFYVSPHTSRGFIRLITNKRWAWAISTCIDSLMGSNMEMGSKQSLFTAAGLHLLFDVELLLCVAKWINQSKQTTGRRIEEQRIVENLLKLLHLFLRLFAQIHQHL